MTRHFSFRLDGHPFSPPVHISPGCQAIRLDVDGKDDLPCTQDTAVHVAAVGMVPEGIIVQALHGVCVEHAHLLRVDHPPYMNHLIGPHCGQPGTVFWVDEETLENGCQPEAEADPQAVARITAMIAEKYAEWVAYQEAAGEPVDKAWIRLPGS